MTRKCGDCQLCCKLLPVKSIGKKDGERCRHQKHGKGCAVYRKQSLGFPIECGLWSCGWLVDDDADELRRPDRSRYVIDIMPDFVRAKNDATGEFTSVQVVQVWCDPSYPDAHRDPALRRWLDKKGLPALVRLDSEKAIFIARDSETGAWFEKANGLTEASHTFIDVVEALSGRGGAVDEARVEAERFW